MSESLLGAGLAVAASFSWSIGAIFYRVGVSGVKSPLVANWLRAPAALSVMIAIAVLTEGMDSLVKALYNHHGLAYAVVATALAIIGGDTLYMAALRDAGVSVTYPIAYSYVVVASLLSVFFLKESVSIGLVAGVVLVLLGAYTMGKAGEASGENLKRGVLEAMGTCVFWGTGVIVFKLASTEIAPVAVGAIKAMVVLLLLSPVAGEAKSASLRAVVALCLGGAIALGLGDWLYYQSLLAIGASRTSVVVTTSLAFSLLLARLLLKERITAKKALAATLIWAGAIAAIYY